jgi:hypothetical protein
MPEITDLGLTRALTELARSAANSSFPQMTTDNATARGVAHHLANVKVPKTQNNNIASI